jgi:large subunit ribosomal protein L23
MNAILKKPVLTEKMSTLTEKGNRFGFIVDMDANKLQIKKAVEETYGVSVTDVNTMRYMGKSTSRYTKKGFSFGRKNHYKKAVVTVKQGDTIDFFSNI